jgi:hypothetical protein
MRRHEIGVARGIRVLVLAFAAVFATSALAASAASAFHFEAEEYPAKGVGKNTNTHVFHVEGGKVECKEVTFTGTMAAASETLRAKAVYKNCLAFGVFPATVSMEGCEYEFHVSEETSAGHFKGSDSIVNSSGKSCEEKPAKITAGSCIVTNGPQTGLKTVSYTDLNATSWKTPPHPPWEEVESSSVITGATYTEGSGCLKPGTHTNGEYSGAMLVKIYNEFNEQIGGRIH